MSTLSLRHAADRRAMAKQIEAIAAKFGAAVDIDDHRLDPKEVYVVVALPGASVSMGFTSDNATGGAGFMGHWVCAPGHLFTKDFARSAAPYHKATTFEDSFEVFAALIQNGLRRCANGSIFAVTPSKGEDGCDKANSNQEPPVMTKTSSQRPAPVVHLAVIDHRHGSNLYAAADLPALHAQLAAFCVEWWDDRAKRSLTQHEGLSDREIIDAYFEGHEREFYSISEGDLASTPGASSPFADIIDAGQVLHDLVEEAIDVHIYAEDDEIDEEECGYHLGVAAWKQLMPAQAEANAE